MTTEITTDVSTIPGTYFGRLDTVEKLFLSMKSLPIQIGNVIIRANDFKTVYFKPWDPRTPYKKKYLIYKRLKAKFTVIAKLIRRYIQYHRQSQYLICFINSRDSYSRSRGLKSNKSEIISVMQAYLMNLTGTQEALGILEKILKFLEQSHFSIRSAKVEEIMNELYQYEKKMQGFCIQMHDLLRNSDDMIISGSYDDGRDEPSIFLDIDDDMTDPSSGLPSPCNAFHA